MRREVIFVKNSSKNILAIKVVILGAVGLSILLFLAIIAQYIDSCTGFSSGTGYHTNYLDYIFCGPLAWFGGVICVQ